MQAGSPGKEVWARTDRASQGSALSGWDQEDPPSRSSGWRRPPHPTAAPWVRGRARAGAARGWPHSPHVSILDGPVVGGPGVSVVQHCRILTTAEHRGRSTPVLPQQVLAHEQDHPPSGRGPGARVGQVGPCGLRPASWLVAPVLTLAGLPQTSAVRAGALGAGDVGMAGEQGLKPGEGTPGNPSLPGGGRGEAQGEGPGPRKGPPCCQPRSSTRACFPNERRL